VFKILLVDDEKSILKSLTFALEENYQVFSCTTGNEALSLMAEHKIPMVLLDLRLGKEDGIALMKQLLEIVPEAAIIIMTAYSSIESSVEAIRAGAYYFITKPVQTSQLLLLLENVASQLAMREIIADLEDVIRSDIIGNSSQIQKILRLIDQVKDTAAGVLIMGESGTGKELVARKLHFSSNRKDKPFIPVNCAALPESLLESELFGHKKGAFTGAVQNEEGIIRKAHGGTLFLDEIGEMDSRLQAKLLRFLQDGEVRQVGGDARQVDVRIICATNRDLEQEIARGRFRADLYYRINIINIFVPPLRERISDLMLLVPHFIKKYNAAYDRNVRNIDKEAMDLLSRYGFAGNVRECENIIQRAVLLCSGTTITADTLDLKYRATEERDHLGDKCVRIYSNETLKEVEKKVLEFSLREHGGNRRRTARTLEISERALQYKIKEYGL